MNNNSNSYVIQYTKAADKFFNTHEDIRARYEDSIKALLDGDNSKSVDVKRIRGKRGVYYRIRIGNYRVIYTIINGTVVVITTLLVGPRGDIYNKLGGLK